MPCLRQPTDVEEIVRCLALTQRLVDECMARVTAASQRVGVVLGGLITHPSAAKSLALIKYEPPAILLSTNMT